MINNSKEAIIFDLGGVLLNLDYDLTEKAFISLGMPNFGESYSQLQQVQLFDRYETGEISSFHFVNRLLDLLPPGTTANQVVHAWDAMILDFPAGKIPKPIFFVLLLNTVKYWSLLKSVPFLTTFVDLNFAKGNLVASNHSAV